MSEFVDQGLPLFYRYLTGQLHEGNTGIRQESGNQIGHRGPFTKDHHLAAALNHQFINDTFQFFKLRRYVSSPVDEISRIAHHAHFQQQLLNAPQVHGCQKFFTEQWQQRLHVSGMNFQLLVMQIHVIIIDHLIRKIREHLFFTASNDDRLQPFMQLLQVSVTEDFAFFLAAQHEMIGGKLPQGGKQIGVQKLNDRVYVFQFIFQRCAGQHQCMFSRKTLNRIGCFRGKIFNTLSFIENNQIRFESGQRGYIPQHRFVIGDLEKAVIAEIDGLPLFRISGHNVCPFIGEPLDFSFPLLFERSQRYNQYLFEIEDPFFQNGQYNSLKRFAEAHFVSDEGCFFIQAEPDTVFLIGV